MNQALKGLGSEDFPQDPQEGDDVLVAPETGGS